MKQNIIQIKTFRFAIDVITVCRTLAAEQREYIISKQLIRSGTSVGANVREAEHAESRADFRHKFSIAQKEINETIYWLELLNATGYLTKQQCDPLLSKANEIMRILTAILKKVKDVKQVG